MPKIVENLKEEASLRHSASGGDNNDGMEWVSTRLHDVDVEPVKRLLADQSMNSRYYHRLLIRRRATVALHFSIPPRAYRIILQWSA